MSSEFLYCSMSFSQFWYREFVNLHFLNSPPFVHFMDVSDTSISKCFLSHSSSNRTCFEILHSHNLLHPVPTGENELVVEVHECKC